MTLATKSGTVGCLLAPVHRGGLIARMTLEITEQACGTM
jgi:hypothetical protein